MEQENRTSILNRDATQQTGKLGFFKSRDEPKQMINGIKELVDSVAILTQRINELETNMKYIAPAKVEPVKKINKEPYKIGDLTVTIPAQELAMWQGHEQEMLEKMRELNLMWINIFNSKAEDNMELTAEAKQIIEQRMNNNKEGKVMTYNELANEVQK